MMGIFVFHRHSGEVIQTTCIAQEEERVQISTTFTERTIQDLDENTQGCMAELVFNVEEVGISDWEDRNTKKVAIPAELFDQMIDHGVSRNVKQISVIICLWPVAESLLVYIVTSQNSSPIQECLNVNGIRFGRDLILKSNQKHYINAGIFFDDLRTVFFPDRVRLPHLAEFATEDAVLTMDNCLDRITHDVIRFLTEPRVRVITVTPYTTQVF
jgi:hypothetical protein